MSSPLGSGAVASTFQAEARFDVGDRILLYSDGLVEQARAGGREIGSNNLRRYFSKMAASDVFEARSELGAWFKGLKVGSLTDDVSFIFAEISKAK